MNIRGKTIAWATKSIIYYILFFGIGITRCLDKKFYAESVEFGTAITLCYKICTIYIKVHIYVSIAPFSHSNRNT